MSSLVFFCFTGSHESAAGSDYHPHHSVVDVIHHHPSDVIHRSTDVTMGSDGDESMRAPPEMNGFNIKLEPEVHCDVSPAKRRRMSSATMVDVKIEPGLETAACS